MTLSKEAHPTLSSRFSRVITQRPFKGFTTVLPSAPLWGALLG